MYNLSWMKTDLNILDNPKIRLIRMMPDGDSLFVLWTAVMINAMKAKTPGHIYPPDGIDIEDFFSQLYSIKKPTVQMGFVTFERFKMINMGDNCLVVFSLEEHQSLGRIEYKKSAARLRAAKSRAKIAGNDEKVKDIELQIESLKNTYYSDSALECAPRARTSRAERREEERREEESRLDTMSANDLMSDLKQGADLQLAFSTWLVDVKGLSDGDLSSEDRNELFVEFSKSRYFNSETISQGD